MNGKLIFQIPIYFRSLEKHSEEYEKRFSSFLDRKKDLLGSLFNEMLSENPQVFEIEFQNFWYSWHYTQIIAFVEICYLENSLKSFYYEVDAKRYGPIMNKKKFKYKGKLSDVSLEIHNMSNENIIENIILFLNYLKKVYKNYYVDTSVVLNTLPIIDFSKLNSY